eukprot:4537830-Pleurochrysis_carterae.AAC.1
MLLLAAFSLFDRVLAPVTLRRRLTNTPSYPLAIRQPASHQENQAIIIFSFIIYRSPWLDTTRE